MTSTVATNVSTKIRAFGGASALALTACLSATAFAQTAPDPVASAPTPTPPVAPGNAEECAIVAGVVTCQPGTDADGFIDVSDDPLGLDVQAGAVVQGPIIITGTTTGAIDGAISTAGDFDGGALFGDDTDVTINGVVQTVGEFSVAVEVGENAQLTNNGTIYTSGDNFSDAVSLAEGASLTNNGLMQTDGSESFGVFGAGNNVSVENSVTGSIITSGEGSFGVAVLDDATIQNDGLVQTFGDFAIGIDTQERGSVTNSGNVATSGDSAIGIGVRSDSSVTNTGLVSTSGVEATGITAINNATIVNDGTVATTGETAVGVRAFGNADITNNGSITTSGDFTADAVQVRGGSSVTNNGLIQTAGIESFGVSNTAGDNVTVTNAATGQIVTTGDAGFGVVVLNDGTVNNAGSIETSGDFGIGIDTQEAGTVTNSGSITTAGLLGIGVGVRSDSSVSNTGSISTAGEDATGITALNNATIVNDGNVATTGASATGIRAVANANVTNNGSVTTSGDNAGAVAINSGTVTNTAQIATTGAGSRAVTVFGGGTLDNSGTITSDASAAVDARAALALNNAETGVITSNGDFAVELAGDGATITNAGTITGALGGISATGTGVKTVINSGSIDGGQGDAVLLGDGADSFQQDAGGSVTGNVNLEGGDDTFILAGLASSIGGNVDGGTGADTAILGGTLDADNLVGFEATTLGTQSDLRISGDRTLQGDVTIDGNVILGLGVDTLTSTGAITLEQGGTVTIETPLDVALVGQTVLVLQEGTVFTDNGGTITIIDDDLLVDYVPVFGSLSVQVNAVNQLANAGDPNVVAFGNAVASGLTAGTLSQANFDLINNQPDVAAFQTLALDALPNLSNGAAREIFETATAASQALNRHMAGDGSGLWGQLIVRGADQDGLTDSAGGYESDQTIFTVGGDFAVGPVGRVGVLASYAEIENDDLSGGTQRGETEIESLKVGAYGAASFAGTGFVNAEIAYLTGEVDNFRTGLLGPINSAYDFDGVTYSAAIGYDVLPGEDMWFTPSVGINGASLSFDDTIEAGGFGFTVARDDADFTELRGSIEFGGRFTQNATAYVRGTYINDISSDARSFALSSTELGSLVIALPGADQDRFELAAGAAFDVWDVFSLELGYLGDFADSYTAHSARATGRVAF